MVSSQLTTLPRRGSKTPAWRHARRERLLGDVLGGAGVAQHRLSTETVNSALEPLHERRRHVGVAGRHAGHERIVGN